MKLAEDTDGNAVLEYLCASAGVECGSFTEVLGGSLARLILSAYDSQCVKELFDNALHAVEIVLCAVHTEAHSCRLLRQFAALGEIFVAHFKEANACVSVIVVGSHYLAHGGQERCSHNRGILAQRVCDNNSVSKLAVLGKSYLVEILGGDKGECGYLVSAQSNGSIHCLSGELLCRGQLTAGNTSDNGLRDIVVAVKTCYLFCKVVLALDIYSVSGSICPAVLNFNFKLLEVFYHILLGNICAKEVVYPLCVKGSLFLSVLVGIAVDKLGNDLAAAQLFNQLQRSLDGRHTHSGVKTLFKT